MFSSVWTTPQYGERNNPDAEDRIAELLRHWRERQWPVIYGRYNSRRSDSPLHRDAPGNRIKPHVAPQPGEFIADKSVNSIFKAAGIVAYLHNLGVCDLVFVGIATDACVSASVREARDLGFTAWVVDDACATFERKSVSDTKIPASVVHDIELGILSTAGTKVISTAEALEFVA